MNKKIIRLALTDSKESRIELLKTMSNNNESLDSYFDKKFSKKVDNWKNNLKDLCKILVKDDKVEALMYLIYKYGESMKYIAYYIGYYNKIKLFEDKICLNYKDFLTGAITNNNIDFAKIIISQFTQYSSSTDVLITAIKFNRHEIFKHMIEKLNSNAYSCENLIEACSTYNNPDLLKILLSKNTGVLIYPYHVKYAIQMNNLDIVKFLLDRILHGSNKTELFYYGLTCKNLEIFKLFIYNNSTEISFYSRVDIAVQNALENNSIEILKFCLDDLRLNKECADSTAKRCSLIAARNGNIDILKFLFDNKYISQSVMDDIAFIAACKGYSEIIKFAVDKGADNFINIVNNAEKNGFNDIADTYRKYIN